MISIAVHNGKEEYVPLLQNFLKSVLACNTYPDIELILIESAGNDNVRSWMDSIDFDSAFVNFDGTETSIEKKPGVEIKKTCLFIDYPDDLPWFTCYQDAVRESLRISTGEYFVFVAEDNQFVTDTLGSCIAIIDKMGKEQSMVSLSTVPRYKYLKANNQRRKAIEGSEYFECTNTKWDPTYVCHKDIYARLGPMALSDSTNQHRPIEYLSKRARKIGAKRYFLAMAPNVWCEENDKKRNVSTISKATAGDPDFLLFRPKTVDQMRMIYESRYRSQNMPIDTNFFQGQV